MKRLQAALLGTTLLFAAASLAAAQSPAPSAPASPGSPALPATPAVTAVPVFQDTPNVRDTFERLQQILQEHPPSVREVLRLDPALLNSAEYLAPYPQL